MKYFEHFQNRIDLNLSGIKDAVNRSRTVLIFFSLASLMIFVSLFNQEFTWQENVNYIHRPYNVYYKYVGIDSTAQSFQEIRKHYADMYFDRQFFNIPILGIKCSGSDLTLLAPIALIIFITWLFFCTRRENHILIGLKSDFDKIIAKIESFGNNETYHDEITSWKILLYHLYSGCVQNFVLTTATNNDFQSTKNVFKHNMIARPVMWVLTWIPLVILLFILYTDVRDFIIKKEIMEQHHLQFLKLDTFLLVMTGLIFYQILITTKIEINSKKILVDMSKIIDSGKYDYTI